MFIRTGYLHLVLNYKLSQSCTTLNRVLHEIGVLEAMEVTMAL